MTTDLYDSRVASHFFPEIDVAGFSHLDGTVLFYSFVAALIRKEHHVLEFGAGRGEHILDDPVPYRRELTNLKGKVARVVGFDVDPIVKTNPFITEAVVGEPGARLPFADGEFDLIVSRYVLEHIGDPEFVAGELMRVLKPGGYFCAVTPNKNGYVAMAARMVPNRHHARVMSEVQPGRQEADVFPTRYKMNTLSDLRRLFGKYGKVTVYRRSGEPAYFFGSKLLYALFLFIHRITPAPFATSLQIFVRKNLR